MPFLMDKQMAIGPTDRNQINRNRAFAYFFTPQKLPYQMPNVYNPGIIVQGGDYSPTGPVFPSFPFNQSGVDNQQYGGRDPNVQGQGDPQLAWLRQNADDARYANGLPRDPRYIASPTPGIYPSTTDPRLIGMGQNADDYRFPSGVPMPGVRGNVYGNGQAPYGKQAVPDWSQVIGGNDKIMGMVMLPGVGLST